MDFSDSFPILLSLQVAFVALLVVAPLGLLLAWVQAHKRYRLRWLVDALIVLPLVLPPTVIGYFLIVVLGVRGIVGQTLLALFDLRLTFTPAAAVIAASIVALPILVKTVQPALESVPEDLEKTGRTLGLGPAALFFRVSLPYAWRGVVAGLVLAFARGVGEFGATLMFAGNIPNRTNTMPLEIFASWQAGDDARAVAYVFVLTLLSVLVVIVAARLSPRGRTA